MAWNLDANDAVTMTPSLVEALTGTMIKFVVDAVQRGEYVDAEDASRSLERLRQARDGGHTYARGVNFVRWGVRLGVIRDVKKDEVTPL